MQFAHSDVSDRIILVFSFLVRMQRKRTRGYYSETVELGAHILPSARMRKLTMSNLVKYAVFLVIAFIIYSVYEKASRSNVGTDFWSSNDLTGTDRKKQSDLNPIENEEEKHVDKEEQDKEIQRRVKQEINKVFEEFKKQQEQNLNKDKIEKEDVFKDYMIGLKKEDQENMNINEKQNLNGDDNADQFRNANKDEVKMDNDQVLDDEKNVVDDSDNEIDDGMFEVEEDKEKEKEELEAEKDIEKRLAEAVKEALREAADEVAKKKDDIDIEAANKQPDQPADIAGNNKDDMDRMKAEDAQPDSLNAREVQKKEEFKFAVDNVGRKLNPVQIQLMNKKANRDALKDDHDHEFPPFVTAVRQKTVKVVTELIASVQEYFPGRKIYIYDLDLDKDTKRRLMSYCGVKMRFFMKKIFPSYVQDLDNLHWKPLVMQTALAEFGHIIWVNPPYRLSSSELAPLIHESHEKGILAVVQKYSYTTYAATHPDMLKFLPSDIEKLSREPHLEIIAILIHNTPEVHQNIMKVFTACAMEDSCLAPEGAKWTCSFDLTGRKPAGCHRFDESALNILLKNWFEFDMNQFARSNSYFTRRDDFFLPKLKTCRDPRDIKDKEL